MKLVDTGRVRTCRCGHAADAHAHYRPGSDCGQCDCARLRRAWVPVQRRTATVTPAVEPLRPAAAQPPLKIVS